MVGQKRSFGQYHVTLAEVIDFASKYDPQPFHLNDEAAAQTYFGRISASGWHTGAMVMRMLVDNMAEHPQAALGSPGLDDLKWIKPVYPGDTLRCESEITEKRRSRTKPGLGIFKSRVHVYNQDDILVTSMLSNGLIKVRNPDASAD